MPQSPFLIYAVPPATPTSLAVNRVSPDSVTLTWRYRDLTPADYYVISYKPSDAPPEAPFTDIGGITDNIYTIDGLEPRTEYVFRVAAVNSAGRGDSNEIHAMTHFGKNQYCSLL